MSDVHNVALGLSVLSEYVADDSARGLDVRNGE